MCCMYVVLDKLSHSLFFNYSSVAILSLQGVTIALINKKTNEIKSGEIEVWLQTFILKHLHH